MEAQKATEKRCGDCPLVEAVDLCLLDLCAAVEYQEHMHPVEAKLLRNILQIALEKLNNKEAK